MSFRPGSPTERSLSSVTRSPDVPRRGLGLQALSWRHGLRAADPPSHKTLKLHPKIARPLSPFRPKDDRQQIRALPAQPERLVRVVDDFHAQLGPAHWVFHDDLDVDE